MVRQDHVLCALRRLRAEDAAAAAVCALEKKMVARGERPAVVKAVIVGTGGFAYTRTDGVQVVPLDKLGA